MAELEGYISKQELYDTVDGGYDIDFSELPETKAAILESIENFWTADVRENIKGEWVHGREIARTVLHGSTVAIEYEDWSCSSCGFKLDRLLRNWDGSLILWNLDGSLVYKFCPNCGAKMEVSNG